MQPHVRRIVSAIALLAAAMFGLALVLSLPDLLSAGSDLGRLRRFSVDEARHLNGLMGRALVQMLSVLFMAGALAVPLTANMYSVKFLDFFVRDPVNSFVLGLVTFAALQNAWAAYLIRGGQVPAVALEIAFALLVVCYATLLPYIYYVFRFLHPATLLRRLETQVADALATARRPGARLAVQRERVAEALDHIGNVAIRSVDRSDRHTAIECVDALERLARAYWQQKGALPDAWFQAEPRLFLSFASEAVEEFAATRSWFEMKLFSQLRLVMGVSVPRFHDIGSRCAKALRRSGLEVQAAADPVLRETVIEFFNTFVRMALVARDARSAFTTLGQYRRLAEELAERHPALAVEVAFYFAYYGRIARGMGLAFVVEAVAHDLSRLVRHAWERSVPNRHDLLTRFLEFDADARPPSVGVMKAHVILASYFLQAGEQEPARLIRERLSGLPAEVVETLREELLFVRREKYWEVNERRMNMDYVGPEQREILWRLLEELSPTLDTRSAG
jgi:hypothetical protein